MQGALIQGVTGRTHSMSVRDDTETAARLGLIASKVREAAAKAPATPAFGCDCGCPPLPDYGACDKFEEGASSRCVYCAHGGKCHPGRGPYMNTPLHGPRRRGTRMQHAAT